MKYLVIAAHPDDEVLGCGGSIAKWVLSGHQVDILIMAEGITSRDQKEIHWQEKLIFWTLKKRQEFQQIFLV